MDATEFEYIVSSAQQPTVSRKAYYILLDAALNSSDIAMKTACASLLRRIADYHIHDRIPQLRTVSLLSESFAGDYARNIGWSRVGGSSKTSTLCAFLVGLQTAELPDGVAGEIADVVYGGTSTVKEKEMFWSGFRTGKERPPTHRFTRGPMSTEITEPVLPEVLAAREAARKAEVDAMELEIACAFDASTNTVIRMVDGEPEVVYRGSSLTEAMASARNLLAAKIVRWGYLDTLPGGMKGNFRVGYKQATT